MGRRIHSGMEARPSRRQQRRVCARAPIRRLRVRRRPTARYARSPSERRQDRQPLGEPLRARGVRAHARTYPRSRGHRQPVRHAPAETGARVRAMRQVVHAVDEGGEVLFARVRQRLPTRREERVHPRPQVHAREHAHRPRGIPTVSNVRQNPSRWKELGQRPLDLARPPVLLFPHMDGLTGLA